MQASVRCVGHFADDSGGQEAYRTEEVGHIRYVARYHDDGHGFAQRTTHALNDGGCNAAAGGVQRNFEVRLGFRGAQCQRALFVFFRNGIKRGGRNVDDVGQNHDG